MESQVRITSPQTYKEFSRCILNNHSMFSTKQWFLERAGSQKVLEISNSYLRWLRAVLWLFLFGECSRSGPSDGLTRIHDVHELYEEGPLDLWIKFLLGNIYLMHWDQMLKYSSAVTEQPNVDTKFLPYYLLFAATWRSNVQFLLVFRRRRF